MSEETEARLNRAFRVGISTGWQEAAERLMEEATKAFRMSMQDNQAALLRGLAREFLATAEKKHPGVPK